MLTPTHPALKIVSDGTYLGTRLVDDAGKEYHLPASAYLQVDAAAAHAVLVLRLELPVELAEGVVPDFVLAGELAPTPAL